MKISFWIDFNCPYSYAGYNRLKNVIDELKIENVSWDMHSYELDSDFPKGEVENSYKYLLEKHDMQNDEAQRELKIINKLAEEESLNFTYENNIFCNTKDAHRLIKLAITKNNQELKNNLISSFFEAVLVNKKDLSDENTLLKIAEESNLVKEEAKNTINNKLFEKEIILDENVAKDANINGTPYFILNNKYPLPGILPKDELINVIKKVKFEEDLMEEYEKKMDEE